MKIQVVKIPFDQEVCIPGDWEIRRCELDDEEGCIALLVSKTDDAFFY